MSQREADAAGGLGTDRIETLADGVFAIAMTLLVFGITVPHVAQAVAARELPGRLLELWPKLLSYAVSFVVLGIYWIGHHNQYHYIHRSNRTFLWINIFFLMFVAFIPFSASMLGEYALTSTALTV